MPVLNDADTLCLGTQTVDAVYAGSDLVWSAQFHRSSVAGLLCWYDSSRLTLADNSPISRLVDLSSGALDATQSTGSLQPVCLVNQLAGKRIARFDGVDDYLQTPAFFLDQEHTFVMLGKANDAVPAQDGFMNMAAGSNRHTALRQATATAANGIGYDNTNVATTDAQPASTQVWHRFSVVRRLANVELYVDGASSAPTVSSGTPQSLSAPLILGSWRSTNSTNVGNVDIAEVLIYNRALSDTERQQVENYLKAKWGLT